MGKNIKGKEIGKGLLQLPDGKYCARFVNKFGKRQEKRFKNLPEARNWLLDAKYNDTHEEVFAPTNTTVDEFFEYWITNIVGDLAPNTIRNYAERYKTNIQPIIGHMMIANVKPMHCKKVIITMENAGYAGSTVRQAYITMGAMFKAAKMNDLIAKHPMDGVRFSKPLRAADDIRFLTREEQKIFLEASILTHNYYAYALILETGLRTGELIGLTWDVIDWNNRTLTVNKTLEYRHNQKLWRAGPPKTKQSYRTLPLTEKAYAILEDLWNQREYRKESPLLETTLEYMDRRTGMKSQFSMRDLVFINWRTGEPTKNSSYDTHLYKLCDKAGISRISMHALRHTYATRAIEAEMQPKVLQKLLGHASINVTMDRYVHVTNDSLTQAIKQFEVGNQF